MTGPTGCGLCGIDSIAEALRPAAIVAHRGELGRQFSALQIMAAMQSVASLQKINIETRAVHAAAFWTPEHGIVALREDVGRHNAVDKLVGWALLARRLPLDSLVLFVSGRTSYEIVQKALVAGIPLVGAVSAPSSLAVELARTFGMTLIGFVRGTRFNTYAHPARIVLANASGNAP